MSKLDELDARLSALQSKTQAGFGDRADALRVAATDLDGGDASQRDEIRRLAHMLRGIAGSAGHPALGERAARLESAAEGPAADLAIAEGARRLAKATDAARAPSPDGPASAVRAAPARAPSGRKLGWRVIALDDEPSTRRLLDITLTSAGGCNATVLEDPQAALAMIQDEPPDLVIVDAMMPETDGLTFYRGVRRSTSHPVPVVILSAASPEELGWELPEDERLRWMRKPFRPAVLIERLRAFVEGESGES